jgi:hypothetical protein
MNPNEIQLDRELADIYCNAKAEGRLLESETPQQFEQKLEKIRDLLKKVLSDKKSREVFS